MRERDRGDTVVLVAPADAFADALQAEQASSGEAADGDDQLRVDETELPIAPEGTQLPLTWCRRAIAPPARCFARVAASHGRAVEGRIELVLIELEPAAQRPARASTPGQALQALVGARRLAEDVRALAFVRLDDRERLEREAGLHAGAADAVVTLERDDRAVARAAPGQERTATNQCPPKSVSPPPSSFARRSVVK